MTNREHDGVSQEAKEVNHLSGSSVGLPRLYGTSPSARKALAIIVIVALAVLALLGATYTQTVSTVHVVAYVARDYGNVNVSVYLDGAFRGTKNVAWSNGPFDESFRVVPGHHIVRAEWSKLVDGMINETIRVHVEPFATEQVRLYHGVGS